MSKNNSSNKNNSNPQASSNAPTSQGTNGEGTVAAAAEDSTEGDGASAVSGKPPADPVSGGVITTKSEQPVTINDALDTIHRGDAVEILVQESDAQLRAQFWFVSVLQCIEGKEAVVVTANHSAKRVPLCNLRPVPPLQTLASSSGFVQFQNVDAWMSTKAAWRQGLLYAPTRNPHGLWEVFFPDTANGVKIFQYRIIRPSLVWTRDSGLWSRNTERSPGFVRIMRRNQEILDAKKKSSNQQQQQQLGRMPSQQLENHHGGVASHSGQQTQKRKPGDVSAEGGAGSSGAIGASHQLKGQVASCPASPMTKKSRASPHSLEPTKLTSDGPCKVQMPPAPLHHNSLSSDKAVTPQITNGAIPPVVVSTACTSSFGGSSAGSAAATGSRTIAAADHTMLDNRVPRAAAAPSAGVVPTAFSGFMARGLPANAKPVNPPALGLGPPGANGANAYEEENKPPRPLVSSGDFIVRLRLARCLQPRHWQRQKRPFRTCLAERSSDGSFKSCLSSAHNLSGSEREQLEIVASDLCLEQMGSDDAWLSGLFIDFLLAKFAAQYPDVHYLPTSFAAHDLAHAFKKGGSAAYRDFALMDVVGKPITTLAEQVAPRVVEGSKATVIPPRSKPLIFFYNLGNRHWNMVKVGFEPFPTFQLFEPMGKPTSRNSASLSRRHLPTAVLDWLNAVVPLAGNDTSWYNLAKSAVTSQQQTNSFDCGVACLLYAEKCGLQFETEDINEFTDQTEISAFRKVLKGLISDIMKRFSSSSSSASSSAPVSPSCSGSASSSHTPVPRQGPSVSEKVSKTDSASVVGLATTNTTDDASASPVHTGHRSTPNVGLEVVLRGSAGAQATRNGNMATPAGVPVGSALL